MNNLYKLTDANMYPQIFRFIIWNETERANKTINIQGLMAVQTTNTIHSNPDGSIEIHILASQRLDFEFGTSTWVTATITDGER